MPIIIHPESYHQFIDARMCANCGRKESDGVIIEATVIDWRTDELCDGCIASFDWSDWDYDATTRTYRHK
jgi:hypothetical protein